MGGSEIMRVSGVFECSMITREMEEERMIIYNTFSTILIRAPLDTPIRFCELPKPVC